MYQISIISVTAVHSIIVLIYSVASLSGYTIHKNFLSCFVLNLLLIMDIWRIIFYTTISSIISGAVYKYLLNVKVWKWHSDCCLHLNAHDLKYQFFIFDTYKKDQSFFPRNALSIACIIHSKGLTLRKFCYMETFFFPTNGQCTYYHLYGFEMLWSTAFSISTVFWS